MKTHTASLACLICLGLALPAFAGPDWQIIEQGRKAKIARLKPSASMPSMRDVACPIRDRKTETDKDQSAEKTPCQCDRSPDSPVSPTSRR